MGVSTFTLRFAWRRTTLARLELSDIRIVVTSGPTAADRVPALISKSSTKKASDPHGNQVANPFTADSGSLGVASVLLALQDAQDLISAGALQQLPIGALIPCDAADEGGRWVWVWLFEGGGLVWVVTYCVVCL
jgi:hypothetical protein